MRLLEFWPDYGPGPLWTEDGKPADLRSLGLPSELVEELEFWNGRYAEEKLPVDGNGIVLGWAKGEASFAGREAHSHLISRSSSRNPGGEKTRPDRGR